MAITLTRHVASGLALALVATLLVTAAPADAAKCTKRGSNGDDILKGTKKTDVLCGRGGNDVLIAKGGKDSLLGGGGDDTLNGGGGNDQLKGQGGTDVATFAAATGTVVVNLTSGVATGQGTDKPSGVENAIGSPQADILTGDSAANDLQGGEGDDTLAGAGGDDVLDGGGGEDKANYFTASGSIDADLAAGTATGQGSDSLPGVENVTGSPQDDSLAGDAADNALHGGAGTDTVSFATATAPVTVDLQADTASGDGADTLPAVEGVTGSPQADTFVGDSGSNSFDGGGGADSVSYAAAATAVTVDLVNGTVAGGATDVLSAVEGVVGSAFDDALIGGDGVNVLHGGDGADTLAAGSGEDQLLGEDGDDQIYGESNNDILSGGDGDDMLDGGLGMDDCDGGAGTNQFAGGCDALAPQLDGFAISPASLDTSGGSGGLTFTLDLSDDLTGIDESATTVSLFAPDGTPRGSVAVQRISGSSSNGTFEATFTVPRYAPQGTWTVALTLADRAGNTEAWSSAELIAATLPGTFDQTGPGDDDAPVLTSFAIAPVSIDTSTSLRVVTFTLDVTDDLAGVDLSSTRVLVASPDGQPRDEAQLSMTSGSHTNGTFEGTVTIPRYAPQGTWPVSLVLTDQAGNQTTWSSAELTAATFPGSFDQTGPGDADAPVLTGFSLSPSAINTTGVTAGRDVRLHGDGRRGGHRPGRVEGHRDLAGRAAARLERDPAGLRHGYGRRLPSDDHRPPGRGAGHLEREPAAGRRRRQRRAVHQHRVGRGELSVLVHQRRPGPQLSGAARAAETL